ncbi:MAG: SpoIID/LytB domain-containing protein [Oscillospiraceae bacterium]|jgi:hypothetical protein|nr:SpoIID/LytB domain-containing protein [Oscillospiraceae bacterium]
MDVTIRLSGKRAENTERWGAGAITLPLEEYLKYVVPSEIGASAPLEAQKAQAVASRSYISAIIKGGATPDDTAQYQAFKYRADSAIKRSIQAVNETAGEVLLYGGHVVNAWYTASNGGHTRSSKEVWGGERAWAIAQPDPWDAAVGKPLNGHGVGMSQEGAKYAAKQGIGYRAILEFYYPNTIISQIPDGDAQQIAIKQAAAKQAATASAAGKPNTTQPSASDGSSTLPKPPWTGVVKTIMGKGVSMWRSTAKEDADRITDIPESALVTVIGDETGTGSFLTAQYNGFKGLVDTKYLVDRASIPVKSEPAELKNKA